MNGADGFSSVLEDLDWLWNEWWLGSGDRLTAGHLRRGSGTLRLLLVDGMLQRAWKHHGFRAQPRLVGPDMEALASLQGLRLDLAVGCIAGGGRQNGIDLSFVGAFRVDNPSTGVPADADEGFAVCTTAVARSAGQMPGPSPLNALVERLWPVSAYLEAAGAVRRGVVVKRREVIEYFRNYKGGVHHDLLRGRRHPKSGRYEILADLEGHVRADVRDGLYFEILSIGQSVARSEDVRALAERIRLTHQASGANGQGTPADGRPQE